MSLREYGRIRVNFKLNSVEFPKTYAQAIAYDLGRVRYGCRYQLHHAKSTEVGPTFDDHSVGVIFVDGLHTLAGEPSATKIIETKNDDEE